MNTNDASLTSITQEIPKVFEVLLKGTRMTTKMTYLLYHNIQCLDPLDFQGL